MNDLAQFQPAFNGVNTLLAESTNIETEQMGTLSWKETAPLSHSKAVLRNVDL
jgi:hypothetical protein